MYVSAHQIVTGLITFRRFTAFRKQTPVSTKLCSMERIRTDFGTEIKGKQEDEWCLSKGVIFEPSGLYSQKDDVVAEWVGRRLMDMTRTKTLAENTRDDLRPEILLAMAHSTPSHQSSTLGNISDESISDYFPQL